MTPETEAKIKKYIEDHKSEIKTKEDVKQICLCAFALFTINDKEVLEEIIPKLAEVKPIENNIWNIEYLNLKEVDNK